MVAKFTIARRIKISRAEYAGLKLGMNAVVERRQGWGLKLLCMRRLNRRSSGPIVKRPLVNRIQ